MPDLDNQTWLLLTAAIGAVCAVALMAVLLLKRAGRAAARELDRRHGR